MKSWFLKILGCMSLACILATTSCSADMQSDTENPGLPEGVPASVYDDFRRSFPDAADVDWSVSDGYAVATFTVAGTRSAADRTSVWYELKDAQKKMQCRTVDFAALPEAVRAAFAECQYGADAAEATARMLTRYAAGTVETLYLLRIAAAEDAQITETTLCYTADGVLVKQTTEVIYSGYSGDPDYRDWLPQASPDYAAEFVNRNYPQAELLYIYVGKSLAKVKILDGRQVRMLLFDAAGNWLYTQTQLHADELPDAVLAVFRSSDYAGFRIDSAEEYLTADGEHYYVLTVKDHSGKQEIRIGDDGTLDSEGSWHAPALPDDGQDTDYLSQTEIDAFVLQRYPGASIVARSYDDKRLEVEVSCDNAKIKVRFDLRSQGYVWSDSEWDIDIRRAEAVPAQVQTALDNAYADYRLCFLQYVETASGENYYEAGLKSVQSKQTVKVKLDKQGSILAEYGKH